MLTNLALVNFKAFSSISLELRPLSVLTGLNNAGKSSVIQAILLAQLARSGRKHIPLNGPYGLNLGEATDVLNFDAPTSEIRIGINTDRWHDEFVFDVPDERT